MSECNFGVKKQEINISIYKVKYYPSGLIILTFITKKITNGVSIYQIYINAMC